jgi:5-methylcytosine-specific restriction enzyme A
MPKRPLRQCSYPLCNELVRASYCDEHMKKKKEQSNVSQQFYNMYVRDKERTAFYKTKQWEKVRVLALRRDHGQCVPCDKQGKTTPANIIDHIIPYEVAPDLGLTLDNLQTICIACHNRKTHEDRRKYNL